MVFYIFYFIVPFFFTQAKWNPTISRSGHHQSKYNQWVDQTASIGGEGSSYKFSFCNFMLTYDNDLQKKLFNTLNRHVCVGTFSDCYFAVFISVLES